ncbi:hypothetical protein BXZ70DRAFT_911023 [Cristinia sonorae]|uniref:F-box domain-containing protein n=1 Tax=Cristinia sonorae TaxID=1940300 RepID=A0A8K0UE63_9AGAR|nr:hypothetical protein BXZ70DRAFT_911023 [Cristinia sonorae]
MNENPASPSSRIPPEIYLEIFSYLAPQDFTDLNSMKDTIVLGHVCHQWRDLTQRATSSLWSVMNLDWFPRWPTRDLLQRSRNRPLHLALSNSRILDTNAIAAQVHRLRSFRVHFEDRLDSNSSNSLSRLVAVGNAPMLRELTVTVSSFSRAPWPFPLIGIDDPLTSLEVLNANHTSYRFVHSFFRPSLKVLHITNIDNTAASTPARILRALAQMPLLEELAISGITFPSSGTGNDPLGHSVTLASLRSLIFGSNAVAWATILGNLTFPASVLSSMATHGGRLAMRESLRSELTSWQQLTTVCETLASKLAGNGVIGSMPRLDAVAFEDIGMCRVRMSAWLGLHHGDIQTVKPSFLCDFECTLDSGLDVGHALEVFRATVSSSHPDVLCSLQTLSLSAEGFYHKPSTNVFGGTRDYHDLTTLHIESLPTILKSFCRLHRVNTVTPHRDRDPPVASSLPFPKLRLLSLAGYFKEPEERSETPEGVRYPDTYPHVSGDDAMAVAGVGDYWGGH